MATVAPGLEGVAESEILAKLKGAWLYKTFRGRVLFGAGLPRDALMGLRCADNLYAHVAWLEVGPHKADLKALVQTVARLELDAALAHLDLSKRGRSRRRPAIIVSASRSGKHAFTRFEAADAVKQALVEAHGFRAGDEERHDVAFRLDILGTDALLGVKLTPPGFRFRGSDREFAKAALRPTVAHALVWLSSPKAGDVFLDPFCGSGSIAAERAAYPALRIIASDLSAEALRSAERNLGSAVPAGGPPGDGGSPVGAGGGPGSPVVEMHRWDARALPLDAGSVTAIVTNPPWGNQIGGGSDIAGLYRGFAFEARRVLARGGKAIVLTDQAAALEGACKRAGLPCERLCTVSLHGLLPGVFRVG